MAFDLPEQSKNKSFWVNILFYFCCALLVGAIFCYIALLVKNNLQHQKISEIDSKIASYGTPQQKSHEKEILEQKKKIDDFSGIIGSHKISSNIFSFIEKNTLPFVWFSNFDMAEASNKIRLVGQAETTEVLSKQVLVFEQNKSYVKSIDVLSSQINEDTGKTSFVLELSLDPKVFSYVAPASASLPEGSGSNAQADLESSPYANTKEGITIKAPKGWQLNESGTSNTLVIFTNSQTDTMGGNSYSANIQVDSGSAKALNLDAYVTGQKNGLSKVLNGYILLDDKAVSVNATQGHIIGHTFSQGALQLRALQLIVLKNGKAYIVTGTVLASVWDTYKSVIESSLLTLILK